MSDKLIISFLYKLKSLGFDIRIDDFLYLSEFIKNQKNISSREKFKSSLRLLLSKSKNQIKIFNIEFEAFFKYIPKIDKNSNDEVKSKINKNQDRDIKDIKQNESYEQESTQIEIDENKSIKNSKLNLKKQNSYKLRNETVSNLDLISFIKDYKIYQLEGKLKKLDVIKTIDKIAKDGDFTKPIFKNRKKDFTKPILLIDNSINMIGYKFIKRELILAFKKIFRNRVVIYYFDDSFEKYLYTNRYLLNRVKIDKIFNNYNYITFIFSDCGVSKREFDEDKIVTLFNGLKNISKHSNIIWLNPSPSQFWRTTNAEVFAKILPMLELEKTNFKVESINEEFSSKSKELRIDFFQKYFGEKFLLLAKLTSIISYVTPEIINLIRVNFLKELPLFSEVAVLNNFTHHVRGELFEFDEKIREIFLDDLKKEDIEVISDFILYYLKNRDDNYLNGAKQIQGWIAQAYTNPQDLNREFQEILDKNQNNSLSMRVHSTKQLLSNVLEILPVNEIKPLNEIKMLIVGQGAVGKTSLVNRIVKDSFNPIESKTDGLYIEKYYSNNIKINIWDFGGQEIYHSTNQFFLTKRSIYLVVISARDGEEQGRLEYWLKMVSSFGGNSPIIIVINKIDEHNIDLDERRLKEKYKSIQEIVKVSCKDGTNIDELKKVIDSEIEKIPHIKDKLVLSWFNVKERLENMREDFISYNEYIKICENEGIKDKLSQETLIGFLHDLGIVLNFRDDRRLKDINVLNPEWIAKSIYKIINSNILFKQKGEVSFADLKAILDYQYEKLNYIISIMRKFELCFDFEDDKFLIPELLQKEEPYIEFNKDESLRFEYHYNILPHSIISRFIVRVNTLIFQKTYWQKGVLLERNENRAIIKADLENKKIFIWINGKKDGRRNLLSIVRSNFEHIHSTISKLEINEVIPIPNYKNISINYKDLVQLEEKGIKEHYYPKIKANIDVQELLNGIVDNRKIKESILKNTFNKIKNIGKTFSKTKNIDKIKVLTNKLLGKYEEINEYLFEIKLSQKFILNINSINVIFIDKLNDKTQRELNDVRTFTIVITNNTIRKKLKIKNYLLIIPISEEIDKVLTSDDSLLAFSHLLSNYIKLSQISPYQISQGVRNSLMFFGREKSLSHISSRELTNYFLIGARQIGKSSFLKEIERNYRDISGIDCYYYTLNDDNLLELLGINLWAKNDLKLEEFIQKIRVYGKPILFLLDEVDKFILKETESDFKILNAFRALSEEGKCFFVMAGYWELYKSIYLNYFSPIKNFGEVLHIEELEYNACIDLATKPMNALNLNYENESIVKEMVESCGQRANLIAINCNLMIQKLDLKDKIITKEMIESTQKSQDFVSHLKFSESDKLAQMILYFTIELENFNLSELVEILEKEDIKFEIESLKEALSKMEIAFYLKKIENRYYYRVPLFVEYIRGDDLEILKREVKK